VLWQATASASAALNNALLPLLATDPHAHAAVELCLEPGFLAPLTSLAGEVARTLGGLQPSAMAYVPPGHTLATLCSLVGSLAALWESVLPRAASLRGDDGAPPHVLRAAGAVVRLAVALLRLGKDVADPEAVSWGRARDSARHRGLSSPEAAS
jgi:hypothetical protein